MSRTIADDVADAQFGLTKITEGRTEKQRAVIDALLTVSDDVSGHSAGEYVSNLVDAAKDEMDDDTGPSYIKQVLGEFTMVEHTPVNNNTPIDDESTTLVANHRSPRRSCSSSSRKPTHTASMMVFGGHGTSSA